MIALGAAWNALPRKVRIADPTQQVYIDAVRDFLKARGIKDPKVKMKRILRVDLDGDGEEEVLLSATNYLSAEEEEVPASSPEGSYSIVLLRRVVAGKLKTQVIAGEVHANADHSNAPNYYDVSAVLDLDGDGKLEVVVHSSYYEGGSTTIYRCERAKITPVLGSGLRRLNPRVNSRKRRAALRKRSFLSEENRFEWNAPCYLTNSNAQPGEKYQVDSGPIRKLPHGLSDRFVESRRASICHLVRALRSAGCGIGAGRNIHRRRRRKFCPSWSARAVSARSELRSKHWRSCANRS